MRKLLLVAALSVSTNFCVNASVIEFVDSTFGGSGSQSFNMLDFDTDAASVAQLDNNNDDGLDGDTFSEYGTTELVNFKLGGVNTAPTAYELVFGYNLTGTTSLTNFLQILFNGGSATLHADTTVNGAYDSATSTKIADFSMKNGFCAIMGAVGFCDITLAFSPVTGYFNLNGVDVNTHMSNGAHAYANLNVTVQGIVGLFDSYSDQEQFLADNLLPSDGADTQQFKIIHDGNMTISVPEPTSLAILGLGLLGFAGVRRRKA